MIKYATAYWSHVAAHDPIDRSLLLLTPYKKSSDKQDMKH